MGKFQENGDESATIIDVTIWKNFNEARIVCISLQYKDDLVSVKKHLFYDQWNRVEQKYVKEVEDCLGQKDFIAF